MKKRILLCLILFCLTLSGCQLSDLQLPVFGNNATEDRLPSVPKELKDHILLGERDAGFCGTLTGDVLITVIFVDDPSSTWTTEDMDAVKATHVAATDILSQQAASYNANVQLEFLYKQVSLDIELQVSDEVPWVGTALSKAGLDSIFEADLILEKYRHTEEAPILLYRNTTGRPFAKTNASGTSSEYAVIFNDDIDGAAFLHELYHLFGAEDYYYPSDLEQLAKTYYPDSIMYNSTAESKVDPLTAYLIGWTDVLSEDALKFLQRSSHLTAEYMNSENEKEMYTGDVENYPLYNGTYTGSLRMGVQHGWGKMIWDDGSHYEGDWDNGLCHGEGTYTWADGNVYTGSFVYGFLQGKGALTWANGDNYTGSWEKDEMHGEGTFTWADGDTYVGQFQHNWEHGQGVMTWNDGTVYEGEFADGYMHGQGTMTYPDGTKESGQWRKGTYFPQ
jgi:hypothetical protein